MGKKKHPLPMTDFEIAMEYRLAKDKNEQIQILAQLNLCSADIIKDILVTAGLFQKEKPVYNFKLAFIHRLRELKGKETDKDMAAKLGMSLPGFRQWLEGENVPNTAGLINLATTYRVSVDWLLGLSGKKELVNHYPGLKKGKAVLISVHSGWCRMIFDTHEKTIEVRKTAPAIQPPFRVYVYQTIPDRKGREARDGRVIGRFICPEISPLQPDDLKKTGLSISDAMAFNGGSAKLSTLYGWNIEYPELFATPRQLSEFSRYKDGYPVVKAPQSLAYVKEEAL